MAAFGAGALLVISVISVISPNQSPTPVDDTGITSFGTNTSLPLDPPVGVSTDDQAAWTAYEVNMKSLALEAMQQYYDGHTIENPSVMWTIARSKLRAGANPTFNYNAIIDGVSVSKGFQLIRSGDTYVLDENSVIEGIDPIGE
jgi:hypothetical protein